MISPEVDGSYANSQARVSSDTNASIPLGSLIVEPAERLLLRNGVPIELGGRAFDILIALLDAQGELVPKQTLMTQVWPNTIVEEANLRVQLSNLRQALGAERWRIKTIASRGYLLVNADHPGRESKLQPSREQAGRIELAVIFIDSNLEERELLSRMLLAAGVNIESLASLASRLGPSDPQSSWHFAPRQSSRAATGSAQAEPNSMTP